MGQHLLYLVGRIYAENLLSCQGDLLNFNITINQ
jgi:hypothetical protein